MKKPILFAFFFSLLFLIKIARAQNDATHVAIIPFTATTKNAVPIAKDVQATVASCFIKARFLLLDRSVTDKLAKELNSAKDDASKYSKVVAEQGRQANAEFIITGQVDSVMFESTSSKDVLAGNLKNSLDSKSSYAKYHGTLHVTIEISKVETGRVIFSRPYIVNSHEFDDYSKADIVDNLVCRLTNYVQADIRKVIPPLMSIVKVEKTKSDGTPVIVLINGGTEMFDTGKQQTDCAGDQDISISSKTSAVGSIFKKLKMLLKILRALIKYCWMYIVPKKFPQAEKPWSMTILSAYLKLNRMIRTLVPVL